MGIKPSKGGGAEKTKLNSVNLSYSTFRRQYYLEVVYTRVGLAVVVKGAWRKRGKERMTAGADTMLGMERWERSRDGRMGERGGESTSCRHFVNIKKKTGLTLARSNRFTFILSNQQKIRVKKTPHVMYKYIAGQDKKKTQTTTTKNVPRSALPTLRPPWASPPPRWGATAPAREWRGASCRRQRGPRARQ